MGGYPYLLILLGAYVRWLITGFKKTKLEKFLDEDQDKTNFIVSVFF